MNGTWHFEWFARLMGGPVGRCMAPRCNLFVNGVLPAAMRRGRLAPDVLDAYRAPFRRSGDWTGTHVLPASITGSRELLAELAARVTTLGGDAFAFLWPDRDVAFRARELAHWRKLLPAAEVVTIRNCGHYLWEEAADDVIPHLHRMLAREG